MKSIQNIFIESCNKIAELLQDNQFKAIQKGQILRKIAKNRDLVYEIEFQSSLRNTSSEISIRPSISIYSKQLKKWIIEQTNNPYKQGVIIAEQLGNITPYKTLKSWNLAGLSKDQSIEEIASLLNKYAFAIFDMFDNIPSVIDFLAVNGQRFNEYIDNSLRPLGFMIFFAPKEKAEQFFMHFINHCEYKARIIELYKILELADKIDLNHSEFYSACDVKLAYVNGLRIE